MSHEPDTFELALASYVLQMLEQKALRGAYLGGGQLPRIHAEMAVEQIVGNDEREEEPHGS